MNHIKYKAWDLSTKTMQRVKAIYYTDKGQLHTVRCYKPKSKTHVNLMPRKVFLLAFTGIHDKNHKEIYEGDICVLRYEYSTKQDKGVVKFGKYSAGGQDYYSSPAYGYFVKYSDRVDDEDTLNEKFEVIGNIYENPELLCGKII